MPRQYRIASVPADGIGPEVIGAGLEVLDAVAARDDALGQLARTFQRMAHEVRAREDRLREQVRELRIEIDAARQERQVAEITDTDYFRSLRSRAADLRRTIVSEEPGEPGEAAG